MFSFFGNKTTTKQPPRSNTPIKQAAEYEPPLGASKFHDSTANSSPSSLSQTQQSENELFGGMTVHNSNYGNTSTYSTSSGSSAKINTTLHKEVNHDSGSSFNFINDDDSTSVSSSATTPQEENDFQPPVAGQIKINRGVGKGRRKNANSKSTKLDDDLKQLDQVNEELDKTYSMGQKTISKIENNYKTAHSPPPIQQYQPAVVEESDDSTISSFLKDVEEEEEKPNKVQSPTDDLDFASLQVKSRKLDRGNSTPELNSVSTPVKDKRENTPVAKEEKPTTRRDSIKMQEPLEDDKEVTDNDWINIKTTINSSLTKYSTKISNLLDEQQKKMDEKRENQFSLIQEKIQSLEQLLDKLTESEEFEEAEKVEQELTTLRSKIEDIQVKEKSNDSYIHSISKILTEMKKEINLVYSRVDFSFTTTKKDYDDFLKKNNPLKELRRERLESETNRIKRMGESIKLEEQEFQKRKNRITDQIDSSTRDLRTQEEDLNEQNDEISREIAELERKLKEKRAQQKIILSQLSDISDKIKRYEEDFNDQLKLVSYDEDQFQKRKRNYMDDVESFEKLSQTLTKDLTIIETKETKKYESMMDKRQYKDYLQTQQVRVTQIIDLVDQLEKMEDSPNSPNSPNDSRPQIIKEVGSLTQQLSAIKSNLSSISLELDNSTQQLQRANDKLPKLQTEKLEYAKARKFKEAAQCKEESDKLTKLIQELESSIPNLKQEQTMLEEQRDKLSQDLDSAHNRLEQVDKIDSKRVIKICLKRIDYLEQSRTKLLEVQTPDQLKLRFDIIDELIALFHYQVRQLKIIISLSDEELLKMKKTINNPVEETVKEVVKPNIAVEETPIPEKEKEEANDETLSPKDRLVKLREKLEELKQFENKINDDINEAVEKEEFDMCDILDKKLEETKEKISGVSIQIEQLASQVSDEEELEPVPEVIEEETSTEATQPETTNVDTNEVIHEEEVQEYQNFNDGNDEEEEPSSFNFIQPSEEITEEANEQPSEATAEVTEEPSSFDFIQEEETQEVPQDEATHTPEQVDEEDEEPKSFAFISDSAEEATETSEAVAVEEKESSNPIPEEQEEEQEEKESSFEFIN